MTLKPVRVVGPGYVADAWMEDPEDEFAEFEGEVEEARFEERLHPRGREGQWIKKLGKFVPAQVPTEEKVEEKDWHVPPPPVGKGERGGKGYSSDEAYGTNTALGHVGEEAFVQILGGRILHPEGKGAQSPLDVHYDGYGFEVKAVSTKSTAYKATPKRYEIEQKQAAADELGVKAALAIVVLDSEKGEAHAYYRDGLQGGRLSERTGWKYLGSTKLADQAEVERAHEQPTIGADGS